MVFLLKVPGLLSAASHEGGVSIHSVHHTGPHHAPTWLKRPVTSSFGFGGKLASVFGKRQLTDEEKEKGETPEDKNHKIEIVPISMAPEAAISQCVGFQQAIATSDMKTFCKNKVFYFFVIVLIV